MKNTALILLLVVVTQDFFSQNISFNHLTTDEGLSQFSVNTLYQDEKGFIWIGTREGLNCYDGDDIKVYKNQKDDLNSLFSNTVLEITGDKKGHLFLRCTDGIAEYDMKNDKFVTLFKADTRTIYYDGDLYVTINNEIQVYDKASRKFVLYYALPEDVKTIYCLLRDAQGNLWAGASNGAYKLTKDKRLSRPIEQGEIISVYEDSKSRIWMGSWENGLFRIAGDELHNFRNIPGDASSISSDFVRSCCEDNAGVMWIGTFNGLNKYDEQSGKFVCYTAGNNPGDLTHSSIWSIIKDHQGTLWLGTYFGGVNYFNPEYEIFTQYRATLHEPEGLSSSIIGKMVEDKNHNLWICTEGGGVNLLNRKAGTFKWYKHSKTRNSISHDNVKAIYYDKVHNVMWLGTHLGGLNRLDLSTGLFTVYRSREKDIESLPSDIVRDIVPYRESLIVATQNGVCMFHPETGKCERMFTKHEYGSRIKIVADVFIDYQETLWFAVTGEGVFAYDFETQELRNYKHDDNNPRSISNNNINCIVQDHYSNLWFATSGSGLDLYHYQTDDFENFDSKNNGLSSDCIYEIVESKYGKLLLTTNLGFSQFDNVTRTFSNFNKENGFPLSATNEGALYQTEDGEIFLGGVQGMVSFYEKNLKFTPKPYHIVFTRLVVNGKAVQVGDESGILKTTLGNSSEIVLEHNHSVFNIEYAISNYLPANNDQVIYRLEGFSDDWTDAGKQHIITYTNLNPGTYTLVMKVKDGQEENAPEVRLQIKVLPPFYKTIYAYILYVALAGALAYYLIRMYKERIKLHESLKYEQKHSQDIENMNQSKLRFFTNISHEIRTPLTIIIGHVEMLMQLQSFTPVVYQKILGIYRSSIQLRNLVTELLDFRKQEQGHMKIKVCRMNLVNFLYENYLIFLEYASEHNINIEFRKSEDVLDVWFDPRQMQKVVNNLVSNAIKYTKSGDSIILKVYRRDETAVIEVEDTGIGIEAKDLKRIFDRFYQTENVESLAKSISGTGIGLALTKGIIELHHGTIEVRSELGKGTTFEITLKLGNAHFEPEQISETQPELHYEKLPEPVLLPQPEILEEQISHKINDARILIVEDNESLREMLLHVFEPYYTVLCASDGEEGWNLVLTEMPDIVLSDIMMPKMSGTDLCKRIKSDFNTCHIPVVLLTARTAIEHTLEGLRIGADDYITKPFNINILISRCNNLVNSRIILQQKFSKEPQSDLKILATNDLDKKMLEKVMQVIDEHLDDPEFNINQFAREMGIARTNFFAKIKALTGQTPNDFILTIRIKKAAVMLRNNPELNITEISYRVGFNTLKYFSKCFKDLYNVSPMAYRRGGSGVSDKEL